MQPPKSENTAPGMPITAVASSAAKPIWQRRLFAFGVFAAVLCVIFAVPVAEFVQFALARERNSYLLLVPVISGYLIWIKRGEVKLDFSRSIGLALIPAAIGGVALAFAGTSPDPVDRLSLKIFVLLNFLLAGCFALIGGRIMRQITFPLAFMIFAVPMPTMFGDAIEIFLQHASAEVTHWMFVLVRMSFFRQGLDFMLPGISIRVAQECSGYNSTFALFMVSTLAGYLFLKSPGRRILLTAAVIPLAIARNAFRITTISLLCVHVDPQMIHSYIHRKGGPIFFTLSLFPFLALLWWLRKSETSTDRKQSRQTKT